MEMRASKKLEPSYFLILSRSFMNNARSYPSSNVEASGKNRRGINQRTVTSYFVVLPLLSQVVIDVAPMDFPNTCSFVGDSGATWQIAGSATIRRGTADFEVTIFDWPVES